MSTIAYITNAAANSGVGHRATQIKNELELLLREDRNWEVVSYQLDGLKGSVSKDNKLLGTIRPLPGPFGTKSINWIRLGDSIKKDIMESRHDILHATNQSLSFIIDGKLPSVVTVHDIIELIKPQSFLGGVFARYLYKGIKRADHIITVSDYTAKSIQEHFDLHEDSITVIPNGVGPEFHVIDGFEQTIACQLWRQNLRITPETKIILYVGSEHPRKNLSSALEAFAEIHNTIPESVFIKVGDPGLSGGRKTTLSKVDKLGINDSVRLVGNVSNEDLNALYNLADVFIYPSTYEGFGLPPLQSMASGTPVVVSNATSLPEVVGEAGILCDPKDVRAFAKGMEKLLTDTSFYARMQKKGLAQAKQFSWKSAAQTELMVYKKLLASRS